MGGAGTVEVHELREAQFGLVVTMEEKRCSQPLLALSTDDPSGEPTVVNPPRHITEATRRAQACERTLIQGGSRQPGLTGITRPVIADTARAVPPHTHDPTAVNMKGIKKILAYLNGTHTLGIPFLRR